MPAHLTLDADGCQGDPAPTPLQSFSPSSFCRALQTLNLKPLNLAKVQPDTASCETREQVVRLGPGRQDKVLHVALALLRGRVLKHRQPLLNLEPSQIF